MNALRNFSSLILFFTIHTCITAAERPNFIIILADDLGYGDLGYTGSTQIKNPNIDQLASSGVFFTNGYVTSPVCGTILSARDVMDFWVFKFYKEMTGERMLTALQERHRKRLKDINNYYSEC